MVDRFGQWPQWIGKIINGLSDFFDQVSETVDSFFDNIFMYKEHQKKGSTNPSNRNKHEEGQARKNRDSGNERGDRRREDRSNKRHNILFPDQDYNSRFVGGGLIIVSVFGIVYLTVNDVTGVGVADDAAIVPALEMLRRGVAMVIA